MPPNLTLKAGLIGFSAIIGAAILLRLVFGISTIYLAPLALPLGSGYYFRIDDASKK